MNEHIYNTLRGILAILGKIYVSVRPRLSSTLLYRGTGGNEVSTAAVTLIVGQTANPTYQEWSAPGGTGDKLPSAGAVTYQSNNTSVATVDPNSGVVTAVAAPGGSGTAAITAIDVANSLTAMATITVQEVAESATLAYTPNPVSSAAQVAAAKKAA